LAFELGLGDLNGQDRGEALPDVLVADPVLLLADQSPGFAPLVDRQRQRSPQALFVSATLMGVDGVGEGVQRRAVAGVPLHGQFQAHTELAGMGLYVDDVGQWLPVAGQVAHEVD